MMYQIYKWGNWWLDLEDLIYKIFYPWGNRVCNIMYGGRVNQSINKHEITKARNLLLGGEYNCDYNEMKCGNLHNQ